jgi:hypothetical protein
MTASTVCDFQCARHGLQPNNEEGLVRAGDIVDEIETYDRQDTLPGSV